MRWIQFCRIPSARKEASKSTLPNIYWNFQNGRPTHWYNFYSHIPHVPQIQFSFTVCPIFWEKIHQEHFRAHISKRHPTFPLTWSEILHRRDHQALYPTIDSIATHFTVRIRFPSAPEAHKRSIQLLVLWRMFTILGT